MLRKNFFMLLLLLCAANSYSANRYWVGSSPYDWSDPSNWSNFSGGPGGYSVPGINDVAVYDRGDISRCTIDVSISIGAIVMQPTYSGSITVDNGMNITIADFTQFSGTFQNGTGNVLVTGAFDLFGGTFLSSGDVDVVGGPSPTVNMSMNFESPAEPYESMPYRDPDPNDPGNGCLPGETWNEYYKFNVCIAPTVPVDHYAIERSSTHARSGNSSLRCFLKATPLNFWPIGEATHRAELALHHRAPINRYPEEGDEFWYGISYLFPTDFVFAPENIATDIRFMIGQWHHGGSGSPMLSLEVIGDEIIIQRKGGSTSNTSSYDPEFVATIQKGQWIDLVVRVKWSKNNGLVEIWSNDQQVYNESNIQTIYSDMDNGGGFKFGIYYWRWKYQQSVQNSLNAGIPYREIFIDEMAEYQGANGYSIVDPGN